jgi:hypothetical protein
MKMQKFCTKSVFAYVLIGILCMACKVNGALIKGISFDEDCIVNHKRLTLRGVGLLKYRMVVNAYVGGFYLEEKTPINDRFADVERRLELHYFHAIPSDNFIKATSKTIKKNVSLNQYEKLYPYIQQMNALYLNVKPGDRYIATYIPGKGTELALNGKPLGLVPGSDFSKAYFEIWLGDNPLNEDFRNALLGLNEK